MHERGKQRELWESCPLIGPIEVLWLERTRARILTAAAPRLALVEDVSSLRLESRAGGDRHDIRTRERLIGSARLPRSFELEHVAKGAEELLWLADVVAGAFRAHELGRQGEPWEILSEHRLIEVLWLGADGTPEQRETRGPVINGHVPGFTS